MKFELNLPNVLTIFRVILMPFIIVLLFIPHLWAIILVCALYAVSAITDALDGYIARKHNLQTEFGAFLDPLADKILVTAMFVAFAFIDGLMIPWWLIIVIALRDIYVTWLRGYSRKKDIHFKTSGIAKAKTAVQMIIIGVILIYLLISRIIAYVNKIDFVNPIAIMKVIIPQGYEVISYIPLILTVLTVLFTIYTGIDYLRSYLKGKMEREHDR